MTAALAGDIPLCWELTDCILGLNIVAEQIESKKAQREHFKGLIKTLDKFMLLFNFYIKAVAFFDDFGIINAWQHFGNKKSVSQNKLCNRSKKRHFHNENLNKII